MDLLNEMTLAGVRYYTNPAPPAAAVADLEAQLEQGHPGEIISVAEERGEVAGFHGLVPELEFVELLRMFLTVDRIGKGYGRELWEHAVETASKLGDRMKIVADPGAVGFYRAMGAELEREIEVMPHFSLGLMWFDLS